MVIRVASFMIAAKHAAVAIEITRGDGFLSR